jgi:hypothetical protein
MSRVDVTEGIEMMKATKMYLINGYTVYVISEVLKDLVPM